MQFVNFLVDRKMIIIDPPQQFNPSELLGRISEWGSNVEGYHNHYDFEPTERFKDYKGKLRLAFDCFVIDVDTKDGKDTDVFQRTEASWVETRKICDMLKENGVSFEIYFSGSKGFHIYIHRTALGLPEILDNDLPLKQFIEEMNSKYSLVDTSIANATRKMRAFGTINKPTGLYKIRVNLEDEPEDILATAKERPDISDFKLPNKSLPFWHYRKDEKKEKKHAFGGASAGDFSDLEKFENKVCIKKMVKDWRTSKFSRHDISLRIANH